MTNTQFSNLYNFFYNTVLLHIKKDWLGLWPKIGFQGGPGVISKTLISSKIQELIKCQCCIKIVSFNVWVWYLVWNFKGYLWNSTQDILPIHWKMCIFLFTGEHFRDVRFKSSQAFLKCLLLLFCSSLKDVRYCNCWCNFDGLFNKEIQIL